MQRGTFVVPVSREQIADVMSRLVGQRQQCSFGIWHVQRNLARLGAVQAAMVQVERVQVDGHADLAEPRDQNVDGH